MILCKIRQLHNTQGSSPGSLSMVRAQGPISSTGHRHSLSRYKPSQVFACPQRPITGDLTSFCLRFQILKLRLEECSFWVWEGGDGHSVTVGSDNPTWAEREHTWVWSPGAWVFAVKHRPCLRPLWTLPVLWTCLPEGKCSCLLCGELYMGVYLCTLYALLTEL